mmetsp:Transcript_1973/g.3696  ORF Transcript_1973/g.3696 Transcript_1973/m.3696 type:complete len:135 (+) Transcript_1973:26-430(+)
MAGALSFHPNSCESQESHIDSAVTTPSSRSNASALHFLVAALIFQLLALSIVQVWTASPSFGSRSFGFDSTASSGFTNSAVDCLSHSANAAAAAAEIARVIATASFAAAFCKSANGRDFERSLELANDLLHQVI